MTDRYAVIGNPVAHSRSPEIHAAFARETGEDIAYGRILAPLDGFAAAVRAFRDEGGRGLNVTLPFKRQAWELAGELSEDAREAQAVNTIRFDGERVAGYNTDGVGLLADLEVNLRFPLRDRRVLVMGAGGASWGVMRALLEARPAAVIVANRTLDRALALVEHFRARAGLLREGIAARGYDALRGERFDLVVNATSAGLSGDAPPLPAEVFAPGALAYDMVYGKDTPFLRFARECAARSCDGLGMLVEQAAASFFIWRGVRPSTVPVIARLREGGGPG